MRKKPLIHKVCGMTEQDNLNKLLKLNVDWFGMIFYSKSKRYIGEATIFSAAGSKRIGVFVNSDLEFINLTVPKHRLDGVQLHGDEDPDTCLELKQQGLLVIKAIAIAHEGDLKIAERYHDHVDYLLFDTKGPDHGGHGYAFDWKVLMAYSGKTPFILAGGIGPDSVEAIKSIDHPQFAGIDVNSKFESEPGIKDVSKIKIFRDALYS